MAMNDFIYIICFYWQGDRWQQSGYTSPEGHENMQQAFIDRAGIISSSLPGKYVNILYNGVKRFVQKPFKFVCFTNELLIGINKEIEIRSFPLIVQDGVLPRMYMFSEDAGLFGHQVLCLDLDVVIVGDLKPLVDYNGLFCTRSKFKKDEQHKLDGDIISFQAGRTTEDLFWKPFLHNKDKIIEKTKGRERYWIRDVALAFADRWEKICPGKVVSYKHHVRGRGLKKDMSIVSCHGLPRPHQIKDNWVKQYWHE